MLGARRVAVSKREAVRLVVACRGRDVEAIGVEIAKAGRFDLVLLDVMLPDLDGLDVAEQLHDMPVVFISARTSDADLDRGRAVGAIDYVTKPFDPVSLPARLQEDLEVFERSGAESVWKLRFGKHLDEAE